MLNQFATSLHVQKQANPSISSNNESDPMRKSLSGLTSLQTYQMAPANQKNIETRILNRPNLANISTLQVFDNQTFNNTDYYGRNHGHQGNIHREANFENQDIEEVSEDRISEKCSINTIPISPIGFKQFANQALTLSNRLKRDIGILSTENSALDTSIHRTPSQGARVRSINKVSPYESGSNSLKPPVTNSNKKMRGSVSSVHEDEIEGLRMNGLRDCRINRPLEMDSNSNSNSHLNDSHNSDMKGIRRNSRLHSQPNEILDKYKETPPRTFKKAGTAVSASVEMSADRLYSLKKGPVECYSEKGKKYSKDRSSNNRNSLNSDGFKKYFSNKFENFEPKSWFRQMITPNRRKGLKCSCGYSLDVDSTCERAFKWISKKYDPSEFEYLENMYNKILLDDKLTEADQVRQIMKDINRTYPKNKLFETDSEGIHSLERILKAIAKYDPGIGYVQGMNFIAGSLLYHAEEYLAFWLMVSFFEILEMRDVYLPRLPGLSKHCQIIDMLLLDYVPNVYSKLCEFQIRAEMFCSEWILTLFGGVAPIEDMGLIYDNLLEEGWTFFYKLVLALLRQFGRDIEDKTDLVEVLMILKSPNRNTNNLKNAKDQYHIDWNQLCAKAKKIELDSKFIMEMHLSFDINNLWFRTKS